VVELTREAILTAIRAATEPLEFVDAMCEGGSAAWGRVDEYSDLDVRLVVADEHVAEAASAVERALDAIGPIELRFEVPGPTWHGHAQIFFRLRSAGEHRLVDLALMKRSAPDLFLERERHGEPVVFFDKQRRLVPTRLDPAAQRARIRERLAQVRVTFALFQSLVTKEIARGNALAALVFYHSHTLNPLALVLRMRHCPERFDFWLKYSDVDLPAPIAATLRRLAYPADLAALARLRAEAEALFHATLAELDSGGAK
jgi:hypothetical protein